MDTVIKRKGMNGEAVNKEKRFISTVNDSMKRTWSIRKIQLENYHIINSTNDYIPKPGDVVAVKISKVANHTRIYSSVNKYVRLYKDDVIIGTFGFRYASDAFHANSFDLKNLHLITNGGLIGTVNKKSKKVGEPTQVKLLGPLVNKNSLEVFNLKAALFNPGNLKAGFPPVVFVVGTGMNSGKTTSSARIGRVLKEAGLSVALLKVTGSVSHRDIYEFEAIGANYTADFSDYGFPSTYLCTQIELVDLYIRMLEDTLPSKPDIVVAEIADGILQRETQLLLQANISKITNLGVILTAPCACSALALVERVKKFNYSPIAVTGLITNSPLFIDEFAAYDKTPVLNTKTDQNLFLKEIKTRINIWIKDTAK